MPVVVGMLNVPRLDAQAPQPGSAAPAFEVASIKPNNSGDGRIMLGNQPGRFTATNVTLRLLIRNAYQLQDFQISGGPGWLASDHFDIVAKIDAAVQDEIAAAGPPRAGQGPSKIQLMIRSLLADRFKLEVHTETKEQPIYALVMARSDGRFGPQLKKSDTDCAAMMAAGRGRGPVPPHSVRQRLSGTSACHAGSELGPATWPWAAWAWRSSPTRSGCSSVGSFRTRRA